MNKSHKLKQESISNDVESDRSIIACPSCKGEFSVKNSQLKQVQNPRFHCSKCDKVFNLNDSFLFEDTIRATARAAFNSKDAPEPPLIMSRVSEADIKEPLTNVSLKGSALRQSSVSFSFKIPKSISRHVPIGAPHETPLEDEQSVKSQLAFSFEGDKKSKFKISSFKFPKVKGFSIPTPSLSLPKRALSLPKTAALSESWRGVGIIGGSIFGFLILLAFLTITLHVSPTMARMFSSLFATQIDQVPPAGLLVQTTKFTPVTLDSGDTVYLVSGTIVNNTSETYKDVAVEGFMFDRVGKVIRTSVGRAPSAMAGSLTSFSKTNGLSLQEMVMLQAARINGKNGKVSKTSGNLLPGARANFAVVLSQLPANHQRQGSSDRRLNQANYYSARVYSVREDS